MRIGIPRETRPGESRVAVGLEVTKKLAALGHEILIESGAGIEASFPDADYAAAGAKIVGTEEAFAADIVLKVACPTAEEAGRLREGALLVSMIDPFGAGPEIMKILAERRASAIGMELIPRITRAQVMDVLSSQANLAGYRAVIEAAQHFRRILPMMMTAAGSIAPAKVFVLGAGVAGLQAIATARRLGAQIEAFDVRPEVREQIESVGAKYLDLALDESGAGEGGYAKELSKDAQERQKAALQRQLVRADIVITTAQIPGRPAPELITEDAVKAMKPGSVIVDTAASTGGNCKLTEADKVVVKHGVILVGHTNYPAMVAMHASQFFARNLLNLLGLVLPGEGKPPDKVVLDLSDDIIDAALCVHDGAVRWPRQKGA